IRFDLPRAIAAVFETHYARSGLDISVFRPDFDSMADVFERAAADLQPQIRQTTGPFDPGASRFVQKYGFPFVFDTPRERVFAWERAQDIVSLSARGVHDLPELQQRLETEHG